MLRLPSPLRRCVAAFAAVTVLFAPVTQVAHARAMSQAAAGCEHPAAAHQQMPASSHHGQPHQHAGTCCDFCGTGCAPTILAATGAATIASAGPGSTVVAGTVTSSIRIAPSANLLPFSLAPPRSIA